ncbi:MAG: hypothetical protein AB1585_17505 [Thermodesulfobacteriota bacterium]
MKKSKLIGCFCIVLLLSVGPVLGGTFTIPDWVMKSCVFVMKGDKAEGTGFLIGVKEQERTFCYFITAKHVILPALQNIPVLHLRLNKKDGSGAEIISFPMIGFNSKPWIEHSNPAVDIAIAPLAIFDKIQNYDVQMHTVASATDDLFATKSFIQRFKIRPGDSAFSLGLVPYLFSKDGENLVLSRSGTISMVGTKELNLPGGKQIAHFLDCAAFGGQSGGPAFVLLERNEEGALIVGWRIGLLGVVTEFVPSPLRSAKVILTEEEKKEALIPIENTGISKVVPVDYIVDLLFSQEQKDFRKKIVDEQNKISNKPSEATR